MGCGDPTDRPRGVFYRECEERLLRCFARIETKNGFAIVARTSMKEEWEKWCRGDIPAEPENQKPPPQL